MANTVQLTKNGESIYPVTDISIVMGGIQAAPAGPLLPPPASDDFATKTAVDELEAKVNGEETIVTENHDSTEFTEEEAITRSNGNVTEVTSYHTTKRIPIPDGVTKIEAVCYADSSVYAGVAFYNAAYGYISSAARVTSSGNYLITILAEDIPSGAKFIRVTGSNTNLSLCYAKFYYPVFDGGLSGRMDDAEQDIDNLQNSVLEQAQDISDIEEGLYGGSSEQVDGHNSTAFSTEGAIARSNGTLQATSTYKVTGYIPIPDGVTKIDAVCWADSSSYAGIAFYNESKTYLSSAPRVTSSGNYLVTVMAVDIPSGAKFIRVTGKADTISSCYANITYTLVTQGVDERLDSLEQNVGGLVNRIIRKNSFSASELSIDTESTISLQRPRLYKGYRIGFRANVSGTFGRLRIGNASGTYVARIEIDGTNIYYFNSYSVDATPVRTIAHGLTISDFVAVDITSDRFQDYRVSVLLSTRSGQFFDDSANGYWNLVSGSISAWMVSGSLSNALLSFVQLHKRIWWVGASYLDYLMKVLPTSQNYDFIMNGYPGCDSENAYSSLLKGLEIGCPDILIWSIGMNDADSTTAINSTWKQYYDDVEQLCSNYGIEFIPVTTPTTPVRYNEFKNAVIRNSGHRYVDVAQSVGADGTGAWNDGLLSSDNVHPTSAGSSVMAAEYLATIPEMIL